MIKMHVDDMSCGGCANRIKQAIQKVDAKAEVRADLSSKEVVVVGGAAPADYEAAVRQAGYTPRTD